MGNSELYKCSEQPTKSKVNFNYNGAISVIQCLKNEKMKQICEKFAFKSGLDFASLYFLYNGGKIDFNLTFYEQANSFDKENLEMSVIALSDVKNKIELKCPNCQHLLNIAEIKDFYNLINYNKNIDKMLTELKSQIKKEKSKMEKLINDIIQENKKCEKELQSLLRDDNFEQNNEIQADNFTKINYDITYKNFDIKLKETIHIIKEEKKYFSSATILKDGRLAVGYYEEIYNEAIKRFNLFCLNFDIYGYNDKGKNGYILIYDKKSFESNLKIELNNDNIPHQLNVLSSGILAVGTGSNIILYIIKEKTYEFVQTINLEYILYSIIELNNKRLITSSYRGKKYNIAIYYEKNNKYSEDYNFNIGEIYCNNHQIFQTKENEICYLIVKENSYEKNNYIFFCFFDLLERKQIIEIKICLHRFNPIMNMITKDLMLIAHENSFFLINLDQYNIIRQIKVAENNYNSNLYCLCMLSKNMFLTGDYEGAIKQWKIEGNEITLFSSKHIAHNGSISTILKLGEGRILSCGDSDEFKIW